MMTYKGYAGKVEFDSSAKILHGEVIGIRDVITFSGKSVREIEKAFRDSVDDYLAFCAERGEKPERPCSGQFMVRVDESLHRKANVVAQSRGESLNALVAGAIAKEVESEWRTSPNSVRRRSRATR